MVKIIYLDDEKYGVTKSYRGRPAGAAGRAQQGFGLFVAYCAVT